MEYWFPEHADLALKAGYALALFGACFCIVGALWFIKGHAKYANPRGLPLSSGFVSCIGGALICLSIVLRIGGAEPARPMERMDNFAANILVVLGICLLLALQQRERKIERAAKAHHAATLAKFERPLQKTVD